jgi:hypothetical protein
MQSGEDIMASMFEDGESDQIQINDPMRIVFRRLPTGQTVMMMMPWLPVELIKENSAMIYYSDIVTVVEPKESMIRYYDKLVERTIEEMADSDKMINNLLEEQEFSEEQNIENEIMDDVLQSIYEAKNKKLH